MHPAGTIFVSSACAGELSVNHLPLCRIDPAKTVSLPVPFEGELLLTFLPEEGFFMPLQKRIRFADSVPVSPLPDFVAGEIWPGKLAALHLSPPRIPQDFCVYPRVLETRTAQIRETVYEISRIKREIQTLLLSKNGIPVSEFSLPENVLSLDSVLAQEPSLLCLILNLPEGRHCLVLREEPTGWHEILSCAGEALGSDPLLIRSPLPYDASCSILRTLLPDRIRTELELPSSVSDPGYALLNALFYGCSDAAASLLSPDLSVQDLQDYLGSFSRILPCPVTLPVDTGHTAWGIGGEENPSRMRLFVFACGNGIVQDIYQWE